MYSIQHQPLAPAGFLDLCWKQDVNKWHGARPMKTNHLQQVRCHWQLLVKDVDHSVLGEVSIIVLIVYISVISWMKNTVLTVFVALIDARTSQILRLQQLFQLVLHRHSACCSSICITAQTFDFRGPDKCGRIWSCGCCLSLAAWIVEVLSTAGAVEEWDTELVCSVTEDDGCETSLLVTCTTECIIHTYVDVGCLFPRGPKCADDVWQVDVT